MKRNPICCLCGTECEDKWGNNPWPLSDPEGGDNERCCNVCNQDIVIPARIKMINERNSDEKTKLW